VRSVSPSTYSARQIVHLKDIPLNCCFLETRKQHTVLSIFLLQFLTGICILVLAEIARPPLPHHLVHLGPNVLQGGGVPTNEFVGSARWHDRKKVEIYFIVHVGITNSRSILVRFLQSSHFAQQGQNARG